jgi:hypothetical protein
MSKIVRFRQKPQIIVEKLGTELDGKTPVYSMTYVDEEGGRLTDYVGPSYIEALRVAYEWIEGGIRFLDRVAKGGSR